MFIHPPLCACSCVRPYGGDPPESWDEGERAEGKTTAATAPIAADGGGGGARGWWWSGFVVVAPGDDSTGGPGLVVRDDELGRLGNMAQDLRRQLATAGRDARSSISEAAADLSAGGLGLGGALSELDDAWETKLNAFRDAYGKVSDHLDHTRAEHARDEARFQDTMSSLATLDQRLT
ncbi:hypothetical protein OHB04_29925 [Streptomyces sp. NBC_01775]|uniref:hypothetical protein n=1 Tax=Streptomyces sp. NBC_01775 TaxID=2975939 RepID=UPI002DD9274A|nr:hypothetical protein [Streptomyces sp. NBC_01775]WSB79528.1 hypothetical protein OHB04_29925 [Streptomyces sp. NBC_01775]